MVMRISLSKIPMLKTIHNKYFYIGLICAFILVLAFFILPNLLPADFAWGLKNDLAAVVPTSTIPIQQIPVKKIVKHIKTPEAVKGIYMTACVSGTPSFRAKLLKLANETEINSIIIDIKDYSGTISFNIPDSEFADNAGGGCKAKDMEEFIKTLHDANIYVIGRITAFQDPYITKIHPDWAVKKNSDRSIIWKDRKGISFADAGNKEMWQYLVNLAQASYDIGFDEINWDYIRFPSDGDMKDIYFPSSEIIWAAEKARQANIPVEPVSTTTPVVENSEIHTTKSRPQPQISNKSLVLNMFFEYLHNYFKDTDIVISADLFGMTATNYDDLNIGQILEDALTNFDYVAPMVYPSHYPVNFMGYKSVAEVNAHPYEIVNYSMKIAVERAKEIGVSPLKLRPWLQDNDYPVPYTPAMVRAQINATYDAGLTSWMLWDAGNTYTQSALLIK